MKKKWLLSILAISFCLLSLLKSQQLKTLTPFYQGSKVIKLPNFESARKIVSKDKLELLKLWESILTGRSAPLSRLQKQRYQLLGLSHLFTPSGFHLSALLYPFLKIIKHRHLKLYFLMMVGIGTIFLPGFAALKRMLLIKIHQNILGQQTGFVLALIADMLFGSFQTGALSFSYSFLFLGIIYSGLRGVGLIIWFYLAQIILALFQGNDISLLLLFFSPIINFSFTLIMPLLFLLAIPLWEWQLNLGLFLLQNVQYLVDLFANLTTFFPRLEVHIVLLLALGLFLFKKWKPMLLLIFLMSNSLNLDSQKQPTLATNEFIPEGEIIKRVYSLKEVKIYYDDGRCNLILVRGLWWEKCFPSKRGSRRN